IGKEQANAFATLGGQIFVTRGLLKQVSSENALAFVLAHEIAHVKHRDPIRALSSGAVFELIWLGLAGSPGGQAAVTRVLGSTGLLTLMNVRRGMEKAADREALAALRRVFGSDCGAGEFFCRLLKEGGQPQWSVFL